MQRPKVFESNNSQDNMKKIKIKYCTFNNIDEKIPQTFNYFIHNILIKHYDVEVSNDPDYVFFHESSTDYLKYDCVRISYTGENLSPNFNLCDYSIGPDYLNFLDRYCRVPIYLVATFYQPEEIALSKNIDLTHTKTFTPNDLLEKKDFCSFVYSNYRGDDNRKIFFDKLSDYKKVSSGGKFLNNTGYYVRNKLEFESKHKFSIAFENSSRPGYTTEKILCSLMANTIPIYWGNPEISKEFNPKRFINCHDFKSFEDVIDRVREVDNDDDLYIKIINEPIYTQESFSKTALQNFEKFLKNIFEQSPAEAKRRTINPARAKDMENEERLLSLYRKIKRRLIDIFVFLYKPFRKVKFIEKIKQNILK